MASHTRAYARQRRSGKVGKSLYDRDLDSFLEAMGAFLNGITNMYINRGIEEPAQPDWQLLGTIILAGRDYE